MEEETNQNKNTEDVKSENQQSKVIQNQVLQQEPVQQESVKQEPKQEEIKQQANTQSSVQSSKFEPLSQNATTKTKKKGNKGIFVLLLLVIVVIGAVCGYFYFTQNRNPEKIYKEAIKSGINSLLSLPSQENATTMKAKVKLNLDIELDDEIKEYVADSFGDEDLLDDFLDIINNTELVSDVQIDTEKQQIAYNLGATYEGDSLNLEMLIDAKKEQSYIKIEQLFDKVLKVDLGGSDAYEALSEVFESEDFTLSQELSQEKVKKILAEEFANIIKKEYVSKGKDKIKIDSKEVSVDKYTLKMTGKELLEELEDVLTNLKDNKNFIKCFEDGEELKEQLEDIIDEFDYIDTDAAKDTELVVNIYRKGMQQEFVGLDIELKEDDEIVVAVNVIKADDAYEYSIKQEDKEVISGSIKVEKVDNDTTKLNIVFDVPNAGKLGINTEVSYVKGEKIDTLNTKGAVDIESISDDEAEEALEKLQDNKLVKAFIEFGEEIYGATGSIIGSSSGFAYGYDDDDDETTIGGTTIGKTLEDNVLETYRGDTIIEFNIPTGYKTNYASNTYKSFIKNDLYVTVTSYYGSKTEYLNGLNTTKADYEDDEYYTNVELSEEQTLTINGKTFYYVELSYKAYGSTYYETHIYTSLNSKELYTVTVDSNERIKQSDIRGFLEIEIKEQ